MTRVCGFDFGSHRLAPISAVFTESISANNEVACDGRDDDFVWFSNFLEPIREGFERRVVSGCDARPTARIHPRALHLALGMRKPSPSGGLPLRGLWKDTTLMRLRRAKAR